MCVITKTLYNRNEPGEMDIVPPDAEASKPEASEPEEEEVAVGESNVACTLFVLICGPVFDALCQQPGVVLDDVPSSLRTTSLTLTVLLAAPSLYQDGSFALEQRVVIGGVLVCAGFVGLNKAEAAARNADAVFSLVGTLSAVLASQASGMLLLQSGDDLKRRGRENLSSLCGALFFYLGIRVVRHAFALPNDVINFKVSHDDFTVRGYAYSDDMVVFGSAFSGTISLAFGATILLNHDLVLHMGSAAMSTIAATLSCLVFFGAFLAQVAQFCAMQRMPALFSEAACDGSFGECSAAYRARRMYQSSNSSSVAFVCAVAMATYAFAHTKRFRSRRDHFEHTPDFYSLPSMAAIISTLACCLVVLLYIDPDTSMNWSDVELLLLLISIPTVLLAWPVLGCVVHTAGQALYIWTRVEQTGYFDFTYFTHHSLMATLALTAISAILTAVSYGLYTFNGLRLYSEPVERLNAGAMTALLSVQFFLTTATLGMASGYSGVNYQDQKLSWRVSGFEFSVQHSVSIFFCAALYASRYEHHALPLRWARAAWFTLPPGLGLAWVVCISSATVTGDPYSAYVDTASFLVGVSSAIVSWAGVGVYLCV